VTLTKEAKIALFAPQTDKVFLTLITINHADLGSPLRFVNDNVQIVSNSNTFLPFPFEIALPPAVADELVVASLRIDNIDRGITSTLRTITSAPTVTIEVVLSNDADNRQLGPLTFTWRVASFDAFTVEGELLFEELLSEPYPGDRVTPSTFPSVY